MTFAFDDHFAMFDITPVENQFILEYLPGAKGEYVKVYLFGLLCCYHPRKETDLNTISRELGMSEEEILAAFRYWERRGIVRRIADNPPAWEYINIKQKSLVNDDGPDPEYVRFSREIESSFEDVRDFHGSEIAACYEWKEEMNLSTEVIIMLLKYMSRTRGKSFRIKDAEKVAMRLADEKAYTAEDAEAVLARDETTTAGFRKVLRKMGMRFNPSDANIALYRKWTGEWHFTQEAIEEACDRMGTSAPSLGLLDAILETTYRSKGKKGQLGKEDLAETEKHRSDLKAVLTELGQYGAPTPSQQKLYALMLEKYPQEIILLAAKECAAKQKRFDSVMKLLESWQERGFTEAEQIREHISAFHEKEEFLTKLRSKWAGRDTDIGQKAMQLLDRWENGLGFSREMISLAADMAFEAKRPAAYMDRTLEAWAAEGIRTPEAVKQSQLAHAEKAQAQTAGKNSARNTVNAQRYGQRDYDNEQQEAMQRMISSMNVSGKESGKDA